MSALARGLPGTGHRAAAWGPGTGEGRDRQHRVGGESWACELWRTASAGAVSANWPLGRVASAGTGPLHRLRALDTGERLYRDCAPGGCTEWVASASIGCVPRGGLQGSAPERVPGTRVSVGSVYRGHGHGEGGDESAAGLGVRRAGGQRGQRMPQPHPSQPSGAPARRLAPSGRSGLGGPGGAVRRAEGRACAAGALPGLEGAALGVVKPVSPRALAALSNHRLGAGRWSSGTPTIF